MMLRVSQKIQPSLRLLQRSFSTGNLHCKQHDGKIAVLTGSTDGIGLDAAKRLGQEGAKIIISSRNQDNVDKALETLKLNGILADGLVCHVADKSHREKLLNFVNAKFGGFDIFFQNAGINPFVGNFVDTPDDLFDKTFEINVKTNFNFIREVIPYMKNRKNGGSIILNSSASGYRPDIYPGAYALSKNTLNALTKSFLPELSKHNIRINCVAPAVIETRFGDAIVNNPVFTERIMQHTPMKKFGKVEEISGVISFLCSAKASYVTGEIFPIGGGANLR